MSESNDSHSEYRGQWGGKIASGEEMWWTEVNPRLVQGSPSARRRFYLDTRQHFVLSFVQMHLKEHPSSAPVVIDYGCGTGGGTINYSLYLGIPLTGFDIFPTQLEIARKFAEKNGNPSRFDLISSEGVLPLAPESVDVILSADVLGHVPDIPKVLADWSRVLKKGGTVSLFTESIYSPNDRSLMARLAKQGMDMCLAVPEHISLFPKETLEKWFKEAGFEVQDRYSANLFHWFFFPTDYVRLLKSHGRTGLLYWTSFVWMKIQKISPFYPVSFELLRLGLTYLFGRRAHGTGYFYRLRKVG